MPPRSLSLVIVAFWLGTSGWLAWHDLWPRWRPGQPPPYTIDLTAEVNHRQQNIIHWIVEQNGSKVFRAETWVDSPAPEVFELKALFKAPSGPGAEPFALGPLRIKKMVSTYRVRENRMLGIDGRVEGKVEADRLPRFFALPRGFDDFEADLNGEVRDGQFISHLRLRVGKREEKPQQDEEPPRWLTTLLDHPFDLKPVPVSAQGSVLLLLHPVNRIQGLRPGQSWRMPVMNPLAAALAATGGADDDGTRYLEAQVSPKTELLAWKLRDIPCLVIRYQGDEMTAATWVEEDTGLVLRQEAAQGSESWVMQRD